MNEGNEIRISWVPIEEIKPYENNPRNNDEAVQYVAASIQEFGFRAPILLDQANVIIAGHTRYKAAKKLGMKQVPCIWVDDLTEEQVRAFRIADNKTAEMSEWDEDILGKEMAQIINIDMTLFGFEGEDTQLGDELEDDKYTMEVKIPQYQITGECPEITDLLDTSKESELIEAIQAEDGITEEERAFLIAAAGRHNVFNYRNIAEYYAHATPPMQRLMEASALVIIDVNDAIANGYVQLAEGILNIMEGNDEG